MKKRLYSLMIAILLISVFCFTVYANANKTAKSWEFIDDGYYSGISINNKTSVLLRNFTNEDLLAIQSQLIDTTIPADKVSAERSVNDPDAILPDNMLPDGTFLKENWIELQNELISKYKKIITNSDTGEFIDITKKQRLNSFLTLDADVFSGVNVQAVTIDTATVLVPYINYGSSTNTVLTPDGKNLIAFNEQGMWIVSADSPSEKMATKKTFNGETYDTLSKKSIDRYDKNIVFWCGQVEPSPDCEKVAFVSNKNDLTGYSIFLYDLGTSKEILLRSEPGYYYLIVDWIDKDNILCYKIKGQERTFVAINLDGNEIELNFEISDEQIIASKDGMIAYTNSANDTVYVGKFENTSTLSTIHKYKLNGTLRVRDGVNVFSPDNSKLALVYVPDGNRYEREVKIFDLSNGSTQNVAFPEKKGEIAAVLEVSWIDNNTLLTVVISGLDESESFTTWRYSVIGG